MKKALDLPLNQYFFYQAAKDSGLILGKKLSDLLSNRQG